MAVVKDAQDGVDLRSVSASVNFLRKEEERVNGLSEGQVITYRNKAGTRFRHVIKLWGETRLVISPYDPNDKYSLALKEAQQLASLARLRKQREAFEAMAERLRATKELSDAIKKRKRGRKK